MAKVATRNVLVVAVGVVIYWILIRHLSTALDWLGATSGRLQVGIIGHLIFGAIGSAMLAGRPNTRTGLVFLCVAIYGVAIEVLDPDPGHMGAQLIVALAFGGIAAVGSVLWNALRPKSDGRRDV